MTQQNPSGPVDRDVGRQAFVCKDTFAGRVESPCRVVGETPTRWQIEVDKDTRLPGKVLRPGMRALVPKSAVRFTTPNAYYTPN